MSQKVWFIDDQAGNGAPKNSRIETPPPGKRQPERGTESRPLPEASQKSPAWSFSLSMFVWGGGQMYLGKYRPGAIYMAAMVFFYSFASVLVYFRNSASRMIAEVGIQPSVFISGVVASLLACLILWLASAVSAYYGAASSRSEPFLGVENEFWPFFGSLLFPGWGQFLNGQPKKGLFFLLFGAAGIFSASLLFASRYLWPMLDAGPARNVFEICLATALVLIPVFLLMWIVSAYDAFRASREMFRQRLSLKNTGYRLGSLWTLRRLIPRGSAVLGLLLAISLGMQFVPKSYYLGSLEKIRVEMLNSHMQVMPELVERAIEVLDR
jgi:TM2 domain-containing membrane protein YozV